MSPRRQESSCEEEHYSRLSKQLRQAHSSPTKAHWWLKSKRLRTTKTQVKEAAEAEDASEFVTALLNTLLEDEDGEEVREDEGDDMEIERKCFLESQQRVHFIFEESKAATTEWRRGRRTDHDHIACQSAR